MIKPLADLMSYYSEVLENLIQECNKNDIDFAKAIYDKANGNVSQEAEDFDRFISRNRFHNFKLELLIKLLIDEDYRFKGKTLVIIMVVSIRYEFYKIFSVRFNCKS